MLKWLACAVFGHQPTLMRLSGGRYVRICRRCSELLS